MRSYCLNILKVKKVAVIGDTTGYGVAALNASVAGLKKDGAEVVYQANIDATQPDMTPDLLRARNAGAEAIVVWSTSTGMDARLFNTRAAMGWDVPFVGHPSMSSGEIGQPGRKAGELGKGLCGRLSQLQLRRQRQAACAQPGACRKARRARSTSPTRCCGGSPAASTPSIWWPRLSSNGSSSSEDIIKYWNSLKKYPGYFGDYTFTRPSTTATRPTDVVMSAASSAKDGTFKLAPGYK